jgi:hypothetical protein
MLGMSHVSASYTFFKFYFAYLNFSIYDFFSLSCNPDSGTEFIPNSLRLWDKWRIFHTITTLGFFVKCDKPLILSKLIKFKYENIKFKKKECEAEHA